MPSEAYYDCERRKDEVANAYAKGWYKSVVVAAREYKLNPRSLQNRVNGMASKSTREASNKRLTKAQEQTIKNYIKRLNDQNMSLTLQLVVDVANYLLQSCNSDAPSLGPDWFKRFMKRNPKLKKRRAKPLAIDRKDVFNIQDLKAYFRRLQKARVEFEILDSDIWNMNETDFRIDCERSRIVITLDVNKNIRMTDSNNRDYVTSVKVVNAIDDTILTMLIMKRVNILHKWTLSNDLDDHILLSTSDSKYINDDLVMNWLHHFIKQTKKKRVERWILLIIDDVDSHMTYSFLKLITVNNIKLFKLSAHFTHLT